MFTRAVICLMFLLVGPALAQNGFSHDAFDRVLGRFVNDQGLVDYKNLKADPADLTAYVGLLARYSPETTPERFPTRNDSLAYWINAYNAFAIEGVVAAYPVKSVREIKWFYGFFNRTDHIAGGQAYTLKHIEHEIVRKVFGDPRIHAALNCASMGCPRLPQAVYRAKTLHQDLEDDMRLFLQEKRNVHIDREKKRLYLSKILEEFEKDFTDWYARVHGKDEATLVDYLMLYVSDEDRAFLQQHPDLEIRYNKYDWRLNDQALKREPVWGDS